MFSRTSTPKHTTLDRLFAMIESLRSGDRFLLKGMAVVFMASLLWFVVSVNAATLVQIPNRGGTLREGIIGTPRFVNPILAATTADQDLTTLIYAGLMKLGHDGILVPHIAESITVSEDGRTYDVHLRAEVTFHDHTPLTTDDVIFTISRIKDITTKSPLRASFDGVTMERINEREMRFILTEPYEPFMENLTVGILPKHIWEQVNTDALPFSQHNVEPIGAGPYMISKITRNSSGIPESYELVPYANYFDTSPKITSISVSFYSTEEMLVDALQKKQIDSAGGLSPHSITTLTQASVPFTLMTTPLPRTFALFFNQNQMPLFRDNAVRAALAVTVDREQLVKEVLDGYGVAIDSPIPPGFGIDVTQKEHLDGISALDHAREVLRDGGWKINDATKKWEKKDGDKTLTLEFSISTANTDVFGTTAKLLKTRWEELGIPVTIKQFEQSDLVQTVIRPRQYDALLFGTVVGRDLDFFSFWHSSQRNDPGLNVALYANVTTDTLLANMRSHTTPNDRANIYQKFSDVIAEETPAIFLYVPTYTYVVSPLIHNISLAGVAHGTERFSTVNEWYMETDAVWPLFIPHQ